jgi:catechol 2,3-dioxygenase-like lactoylglutathione lyase family enzyme
VSITRIGHISLTVTDLDRSVDFAERIIGLRLVERDADGAYLTSCSRHHQLALTEGAVHTVDAVGFDVARAEDLDAYAERLCGLGLSVDEGRRPSPGIARSVWFDVPDGPTIQLCAGVDVVADTAYAVLGTRPRKFGHATFSTADPAALERVLVDGLGFRVSDRIPGQLAWLRCNADHHGVGIVTGRPGLNHYAFEIDSWASFQQLGDHIIQSGARFVWGPGRHGPGNNLFAYVEDADGSMCEFFTDLRQIVDERTYEPKDWPSSPISLNQWGPGPDPAWFEYSTAHQASVRERETTA